MDVWDLMSIDVYPHHPVVLQSDPGAARAIVIKLPTGEELQEHQVHEHAWLHVHEGVIELEGNGTTTPAAAGALIHWPPGERHAVRAVEDALLLLFLAPWPGRGHPGARDG